MKIFRITFFAIGVIVISLTAFSQDTNLSKIKHETAFIKARSVLVDFFHAPASFQTQTFKNLYSAYNDDKQKSVKCSFLMLNNLARATEFISEQEAFDCINTFLTQYQHKEQLKIRYFERIFEEAGFTPAMDFLQIEAKRDKEEQTLYSMLFGKIEQ